MSMPTPGKSVLFWATVITGAVSIGGMYIDLRYKIWLCIVIFALFVSGPLALFEMIWKRQFRTWSICFVLTLIAIGGIVILGRHNSENAKIMALSLKANIVAFQSKEGRAPTLEELSRSLNLTEPIKFSTPGVRLRYDQAGSRGPCLTVYRFPSSWLRTCVDPKFDEVFKDDL